MTSTVTYDKLETNVYENLFELLNDRTNIPDPRNRGKSARFLFDYDPLDSVTSNVRQSDFPHIVLFPLSEVSSTQHSTRGTTKRYTWTTTLIVRSVRRGASGADRSLGRSDLHKISDSLHEFFNTLSERNLLNDLRMRNVRLTKVSTDTGILDGTTEFVESQFQLTFSARLDATS